MKRLDLAIAVWGDTYVDTLLTWALPSFLAPGNIPACSSVVSARMTIVTRPEDRDRILGHPIAGEVRKFGELIIVPLLTESVFKGTNRYDIMALSHRYCIAESLRDGAVISLLSPDCLVSDGSLSFGLGKIRDGAAAVLVAGPRAEFELATQELSARKNTSASTLNLSGRDLSSLVRRFPHDISRLLYWEDQPFSRFPSAVYWRAGDDSFLARYFHLHPLFVDLTRADNDAASTGTIDGTLLLHAKIGPDQVFVNEHSDNMCVIEMSRASHDPMGSRPHDVARKQLFVARWAMECTDARHRAQFKHHFFKFQGHETIEWARVIKRSQSDTAMLDVLLEFIGYLPRASALRNWAHMVLLRVSARARKSVMRWLPIPLFSGLHEAVTGARYQIGRIGRVLTRALTPGPAAAFAQAVWCIGTILARGGVRAVELYGRLLNQVLSASRLGNWANRSLRMPDYIRDHMQDYYDSEIVPARARNPGPVTTLLYLIARGLRVIFVVNIAPGTGHNTVEIDYFLRRLYSGELDRRARYIFLRLPTNFHIDTVALYRRHFWAASSNRFVRNLIAPVIAAHPEVRLDCGLSRLKWHLRDDLSFSRPPRGQSFLYQVSKEENRQAWLNYYRLRARTGSLTPLSDGLTPDLDLRAFLGSTERLALFHVKFHVANATAAPTDPSAYLEAMKFLKSEGYRVVHVGREPMPEVFKSLGVINYAESPVASYRHDLQLFAIADLAVTAGSGIALLPDCMGVPFVYLDSWHLGMPMASEHCVMVPALAIRKSDGRPLSFREQMDLYFEMADKGDEIFPSDIYAPRNATADEVLAAVRETLKLRDEAAALTEAQERFRALDRSGLMSLSRARVSDAFLRKHAALLSETRIGVTGS
ncbi:MAG TPA: TIGR04372 family glycosyltransferase [Stellaceae bacterium]|nr:TIGR04372 family glycosyltransferase [Stellaceae bacterium]